MNDAKADISQALIEASAAFIGIVVVFVVAVITARIVVRRIAASQTDTEQ